MMLARCESHGFTWTCQRRTNPGVLRIPCNLQERERPTKASEVSHRRVADEHNAVGQIQHSVPPVADGAPTAKSGIRGVQDEGAILGYPVDTRRDRAQAGEAEGMNRAVIWAVGSGEEVAARSRHSNRNHQLTSERKMIGHEAQGE